MTWSWSRDTSHILFPSFPTFRGYPGLSGAGEVMAVYADPVQGSEHCRDIPSEL
jgi:hypothetical protein